VLPGGAKGRLAQAAAAVHEDSDDESDVGTNKSAASYKTPSHKSLSDQSATPAGAAGKSRPPPQLRRMALLSTPSPSGSVSKSIRTVQSSKGSRSTIADADDNASEAAETEADQDADDLEDEAQGPPRSRCGRMDKASRVKHNSEKELASMLSMFGEEAHWQNAKKKNI